MLPARPARAPPRRAAGPDNPRGGCIGPARQRPEVGICGLAVQGTGPISVMKYIKPRSLGCQLSLELVVQRITCSWTRPSN